MATIRISARGMYCVLVDSEVIAACTSLEAAMKAARGYQIQFGWL
jgi:hypothetical protein